MKPYVSLWVNVWCFLFLLVGSSISAQSANETPETTVSGENQASPDSSYVSVTGTSYSSKALIVIKEGTVISGLGHLKNENKEVQIVHTPVKKKEELVRNKKTKPVKVVEGKKKIIKEEIYVQAPVSKFYNIKINAQTFISQAFISSDKSRSEYHWGIEILNKSISDFRLIAHKKVKYGYSDNSFASPEIINGGPRAPPYT
ncbi:hypothetical protein [Chryseobacterium sp. CT-SW4]|uniref:hypothetical protein n=1 Tax=Chryseobacterium sp. SW-1 TaxID=3157343 RepID=UPI003B02B000